MERNVRLPASEAGADHRWRGRICTFAGVLFVFLVVASILSRVHLIETRPLAGRLDTQEPESHILITELAFEQTPWTTHHFLPIFTLGPRYNKYVDEHPSAESADEYGNYYFTSTPPLTFVIPWLAAKVTVGSPTLVALRWYNVGLQILSAALLGLLVWLSRKSSGFASRLMLALMAAAIYMAAPESLKSHTIALWAQQFYCVALIVELIVLFFWPSALLLFLLSTVSCLADWTPYLAHIAMTAVAAYSFRKTRNPKSLKIAISLIAGCVVGGVLMIGWFDTVMPVSSYFADLAGRAQARATVPLTYTLKFIPLYVNSFGPFALVALVALLCRPWVTARSSPQNAGNRPILPAADPLVVSLGIVAFALLENLLMQWHSLNYSYDRLKGVEFLALFIVWAASANWRKTCWLFGVSALAGVASIWLFVLTYDTPGGGSYIAHSEQERIGALIEAKSSANGPSFFSDEIRGSEIYYAGRNVVQTVTYAAHRMHVDSETYVRDWCRAHGFTEGTLFEISGSYPFPFPEEMPRTVHVRRVFTAQPTLDLGSFTLDERWEDYHPHEIPYCLDPIRKISAADYEKARHNHRPGCG